MLKSLLWLFAATIIGRCFCNGRSFNITAGCIQIERQALLEIKSNLTDPSNRLASWSHTGADCCRWYGVVCNEVTGHVLELHLRSISDDDYFDSATTTSDQGYPKLLGKVSPSLLKLKYLRYLDLSNNNFGGTSIPKFLGSMGSLRFLNLSKAGFGGKIPHQLGNLSNLQYLSITGDLCHLQTESLNWLSGLSSLKFLELANVEVGNASNWLKDVNTLPSLEELHLPHCSLTNVEIPALSNVNFSSLFILDLSGNGLTELSLLHWISQLQSLASLHLGENQFEGPIPNYLQNLTSIRELNLSSNGFNSLIPNWLYGFSYLEVLKLDGNVLLQGDISSGFGNLTSLVTLDLSHTGIEGQIPPSFKNLCNLRSLLLSDVKLNQEFNQILEILSGCASNGLESLDLSNCHLSGHLTHHLGQFKALEELGLSSNKLNGTLPLGFGGLSKLEDVSIDDNLLAGDVFEIHFINLTELRRFYADGNQLRLRVSSQWSPPFQKITGLFLNSWIVGPQFPRWLGLLKYLSNLGLSNCGISSTIPRWFWKLSTHLQTVDLSNNKIEGELPNKLDTPSSFVNFDLSTNLLKGPLSSIFSSTNYLDLSNNLLSGSLSDFLCSDTNGINSMRYLILEGNRLKGEIPDCWMNRSELEVLELSSNKFHGYIPMSIGTLVHLESLHLRNNNLSGKIPISLGNCSKLLTLDLSQNQLMGAIPDWFWKRFPSMVSLNLRENNFDGKLPRALCHLSSLQILDLADNYFYGPIPNCIKNFSAMVMDYAYSEFSSRYVDGHSIFMEKAFVMRKGELVEYNTTLKLVRSLDLSSNKLSGEIPKEITSFKALQSLNLSSNLLSGRIPEDIGIMKSLESIDFSQNQLSDNIPQSLANLNFLSYLNLSYNNLSGRIPSGTQIQSFGSSSFYGNKKLCGKPLTNNCSEDIFPSEAAQDKVEVGKGHQVDWFYVSMEIGFVVGLWGVIGPLVFNKRWRYEYFCLLDRLAGQIYQNFH